MPAAAEPDEWDVEPWNALLAMAEGEPADLLVVTGDLAQESGVPPRAARGFSVMEYLRAKLGRVSRGTETDGRTELYKYAQGFLRRLGQAHGLAGRLSTSVVVCPGNHDVDWGVALTRTSRSRDEFVRHLSEFCLPMELAKWLERPDLGLKLMVLDSVFLGGTLVGEDGAVAALGRALSEYRVPTHAIRQALVSVLRHDIAAFPLKAMQQLLGRLRREMKVGPGGDVVGPCLGIAVSHHPPTNAPTSEAEVKAFEPAIGAAQAVQILHGAGIRLFLHGHKHLSFGRTEITQSGGGSAQRVHLLGATTLHGEGARGFTVIRYIVSPVTGEAFVLAQPYTLENLQPRISGQQFTFTTEARTLGATRLIRLVERIDTLGDSRGDCYFHEIDTMGWKEEAGVLVRRIRRFAKLSHGQTGLGRLESLDPSVSARAVDVTHDVVNGRLDYSVELRTPKAREVNGRPVKHCAGFVERLWANNVFALSKWEARRTGGLQWLDRGDPESRGMEWYAYVVRDPVEALEMFLCFPFKHDGKVVLKTCHEDDQGGLVFDPRLLAFTRYSIDRAVSLRRLRIRIHRPITGVAYVVQWELLDEQPGIFARIGLPSTPRVNANYEVGKLLDCLRPLGGSGATNEIVGLFNEFIQDFTRRLVEAGGVRSDEELEWVVFAPEGRPFVGGAQGDSEAPIVLAPLFANYPAGDRRWGYKWVAGRGVAGRAYGSNLAVLHVAEGSRPLQQAQDPWTTRDVPVYIPLKGEPEHSVLFGVPIRSDNHGDVLLGSLCVGSYVPDSSLSLDVRVSAARASFTERKKGRQPAELVLVACLKLLYREWVARLLRGKPCRR